MVVLITQFFIFFPSAPFSYVQSHIALHVSVRMLQTVERPMQKLNANDACNKLYIEIEIIHKLM